MQVFIAKKYFCSSHNTMLHMDELIKFRYSYSSRRLDLKKKKTEITEIVQNKFPTIVSAGTGVI